MAGWAVPVAALLSSVLADTTAPVLQIEDAQAFIFHILMTVRINEDGRIYCGALETATSYTPSIFQMTTGSGLVGYDSATVSAFSYVNLVVGVLVPSTTYDVFCYAEDLFLNGFTLAQVAGTKLTLATASGGDYTAPTFSYVSPTFVVESIAVSVYFQLNEDGTVWCVAKIDTGAGTTRPSAADFQTGSNVDSWGSTSVAAQQSFQGSIKLIGLTEDTDYDVYCFAQDMGGNFIDGTPALTSDTSKIDATKLDIRTLNLLVASRLTVGNNVFVVKAASWNVALPLCSPRTGPKMRCEADVESFKMVPKYQNVKLIPEESHRSDGCFDSLPVAPALGGPFALLLRRGTCSFAKKAFRAQARGFDMLLVMDDQAVQSTALLPDMTADAGHKINIPSWIITKTDGDAVLTLHSQAAVSTGYLSMKIEDAYRVPHIGIYQSDVYGQRYYQTE